MNKKILPGLIHRLPQNVMSRTMGKITASRFSRLAIRHYIRHYNIDPSIVEKPIREYRSLKEFFARRLKPGVRTIAPGDDVVASPVDGTVSQMGDIHEGTLIQAKGKQYSLADLLGDTPEAAKRFYGGKFITIYLSPRDYHRIHMPVEGDLIRYTYVPGRLYPVNQLGIEHVDKLFARNERLVTHVLSPICKHLGCTVNWNTDPNHPNEYFCPCHLGRYDIEGAHILGTPPTASLDEYETEVKDGKLYLGKLKPNPRPGVSG